MANSLYLFNDPQLIEQLRPICDHRPLSEIILGTSTISQKWAKEFDLIQEPRDENCLQILGSLLPQESYLATLKNLRTGEGLYKNNQLVAFRGNRQQITTKIQISEAHLIEFPEDILTYQKEYLPKEIRPEAFDLSKLRELGNQIIEPSHCFIHPTANIKGSILDASKGPIYVGEGVEIQIGSLIQGPAALLKNSITNLGAKIRPFTTIGENCKVGGEISYSIVHANSNKAHDGYLGNSVIGSFCNFGALSNSSNVRNDLKNISLYDYSTKSFRQTSVKSIGLITGDYITTGIGTQFNTATSIGSHCNITCHQFPEKYIPAFTWGQDPQFSKFKLEKAIEIATTWSIAKGKNLSEKTRKRIHEIWKEV